MAAATSWNAESLRPLCTVDCAAAADDDDAAAVAVALQALLYKATCCCCCREDIPLAAIDFHVAPALTEHLLAQQQLQAAIRSAAATSTPIAAQLTGLGAASLVNSTLWMFRSSYNRKGWLQERYQQQQTGGYAQQVGGSV
jgi:hypothetical protein